MKSVLISVHPKWWKKICTVIGHDEKFKLIYEKSVEVRKTRPKIDVPFKVLVYETKAIDRSRLIVYVDGDEPSKYCKGCGKVVGEFVCKCISEWYIDPQTKGYFITSEELTATCLTYEQLHEYGNGKTLYGWHISNLVIYDKPRELKDFVRICPEWEKGEITEKCLECEHLFRSPVENLIDCDYEGEIPITRPPQSWCYVESEVQGE